MDETTAAPPSGAHALPPRRQLIILAVVAVAAVAILFGLPALGGLFAPKPPPPPPAPPAGTFRVTPEQWASLSFATLQSMSFQPGVETDGAIATEAPAITIESGNCVDMGTIPGWRANRSV